MEVKLIEIRDASTFIPAMAIRLEPGNAAEGFLLARAGFFSTSSPWGNPYVILMPLEDLGRATYAPGPGSRTHSTVHRHLREHWSEVASGDVLDVRYLLRETGAPVDSEFREFQGGDR